MAVCTDVSAEDLAVFLGEWTVLAGENVLNGIAQERAAARIQGIVEHFFPSPGTVELVIAFCYENKQISPEDGYVLAKCFAEKVRGGLTYHELVSFRRRLLQDPSNLLYEIQAEIDGIE